MSYKRISPQPVVEGGTGAQTLGSTQILIGSGTSPVTSTSNATINTGTGAILLNSGTGTLDISNDASATTVTVGTGGAAKTVTLGSASSTSSTTVQSGSGALNVTATNGALTINSGTGALGISTDASATTVSFATGGAAKTVSLGSTNTTSTTTVQSGSGGISLATSTNGTIALTSGTGAINIGTNANAKTITIGATTTTSTTNINMGTGGMAVASVTGTLITQKSTGEMTRPFQPAFDAYLPSVDSNVTGDSTTYVIGTNVAWTKVFDQGTNFNTNGTFTAPVTGRYYFYALVRVDGVTAAMNDGYLNLVPSSGVGLTYQCNPGVTLSSARTNTLVLSGIISLSASATVTLQIQFWSGTKVADIFGAASTTNTRFGGYLIA